MQCNVAMYFRYSGENKRNKTGKPTDAVIVTEQKQFLRIQNSIVYV